MRYNMISSEIGSEGTKVGTVQARSVERAAARAAQSMVLCADSYAPDGDEEADVEGFGEPRFALVDAHGEKRGEVKVTYGRRKNGNLYVTWAWA